MLKREGGFSWFLLGRGGLSIWRVKWIGETFLGVLGMASSVLGAVREPAIWARATEKKVL